MQVIAPLGALLVVLVIATIPLVRSLAWPGERAVGTWVEPERDFSAEEVARARSLRKAALPMRCWGLALPLLVIVSLGFTPLGSWLVTALAVPLGGGWFVRALLAGPIVVTAVQLVTLPIGMARERIARRFGLSRRGWGLWAADALKSYLINVVFAAAVMPVFYAMPRWSPDWWWVPTAALAALAVVVLSMLAPLVLEPLFSRFEPLPDGPLKSRLLELAAADQLTVKRVLVADASRRTTALNAYVSGIGATRRIVIYDTLLKTAEPIEIELVVAHELGHAVHRDVSSGTILGALGAAAGCVALAVALPALSPLVGTATYIDPAGAPLVIALAACAGLILGPAQNAVSRRVEARADEHSLSRTGDPAAFIAMQRRLAVTNIADLTPSRWSVLLFGSHPPTVARIAHARAYAAKHGIPLL